MIKYITRRIFYGILVMLGVVVVVFFLFQGFGDPSRLVMGQRADAATQENIRKELYLDQPKWKQFFLYLNDISPIAIHSKADIEKKQLRGFFAGGETKIGVKVPYLRRSYQTKKDVWTVLMEALPGTIILAIAAMVIAILLGISLGHPRCREERIPGWTPARSSPACWAFQLLPFFMGIVIAYIFGFLLSDVTGLHMTGSWFDIDETTGERYWSMQNLILPAFTLGIRPLAIITQLTRSSMLDVLTQDYIRTAYAKGLSKRVVVWRHGLRNALNPVITAITGWFAELLAGAFFVEYIFGWKGIGKVTVDALEKLDFPVVMGSVLISSFFFIVIGILADLLYGM